MKTELMVITPSPAKAWLEKNHINRDLSDKTVSLYAREMLGGRWHTTHQGIALYKNGALADGQHRLNAIIKANIDIPMLVTTGLDEKSVISIDEMRARTIYDILKMGGYDITAKEVQTLRMAYEIDKVSAEEILLLSQPVIDSLRFTSSCFSKNSKGVNASLRACFLLAHHYGEDADRLVEFSEMFYSGVVKNEKDMAVIRIRDYLITSTLSRQGNKLRQHDFSKAQFALKKFLEYKAIGSVRTLENLPFPKLDPKPILNK